MGLMDEVKIHLSEIKKVKGVENCVLTQRDGNPIQSVGVWLSQDEVFKVCAANSAIYNCGLELHKGNLKYILIEGARAKILLAPLRNTDNPALDRICQSQGLQGADDNFYIAITMDPSINLGSILLKVRDALIQIKKALIMSGETFTPPLRKYSATEVQGLLSQFSTKESTSSETALETTHFTLNSESSGKIQDLMTSLALKVTDLIQTFITVEGGFILASKLKVVPTAGSRLDAEGSMAYSLFKTADQCAWFLRKMQVTSIVLECKDTFQFINRLNTGVVSTQISKGAQRLGLLRMIIPKYILEFDAILAKAKVKPAEMQMLDLKALVGELVIV